MKTELLKRTLGNKRIIIEITDRRQDIINSIIAKHRSEYLRLWKAASVTESERLFMDKFDRIIGGLQSKQRNIVGTW